MIIFKDKNGELITDILRIEIAKKLLKHIKLDVKLKGNLEAYLNDNPKAWTYFSLYPAKGEIEKYNFEGSVQIEGTKIGIGIDFELDGEKCSITLNFYPKD